MNLFFREVNTTIRLAFPLIVALFAQKGLQLISSLMMGLLGANALAAAALSTTAYMAFVVIGVGMLNVVGVLISQAFGANNKTEVTAIFHHGLYASFLLSSLCMVVIWYLPALFLKIGQPVQITELSAQFLHAAVLGFPALLGFFVLREYVSALNHPRLVVIISLLALPLNALLSYCLIYGKLGLPALQIQGIGYANALTEWFMFFALCFYLYKHPVLGGLSGLPRLFALDTKLILRIFRLGFPVGMSYFLDLAMCAILAMMMGYFGVFALAAHQIAFQCVGLVYMVPLGISFSMSLLVARNVGAKKYQAVHHTIYAGLALGSLYSLVVILLFVLFPDRIINLFIRPEQANYILVKQLAIAFLGVGGIFLFFDMLQGVFSGCLRGFRDTFIPMTVAIFSFLVVGLGLGYYFGFVLNWQGTGLWWGLAAGLFAHSIFLSIRLFFHLKRLGSAENYLPKPTA